MPQLCLHFTGDVNTFRDCPPRTHTDCTYNLIFFLIFTYGSLTVLKTECLMMNGLKYLVVKQTMDRHITPALH